uniref:RING-type domain-containing protein n=1 Tax=Kalanchoe fedtschenkoi TaxID=63787 RepID=A0A7N0TN55_KALFE
MTELEVAECPVCLQSFDDDVAIPRVLGCGHSVCEACLKQLPQPFPDTLRCPACTQLVKIPPQGPSALPKNIDLLRLTHSAPPLNPHTRSLHNPTTSFMPHLWPPNFDSAWKDWVLPEGSVHPASSTITPPLSSSRPAFASRVIKDNQKVSLVRITMLSPESDSLLQLSYFAKVMSALNRMEHGMRDQLRLILKACSIRSSLVSDVYGFWHSLDDSFLYLVFEDKKCAKFTEKIDEVGYSPTGANFSFGAMGMEICEALMTLHSEGLVLGCLGLGCLGFDEFRHICVDMSGVLMNAHGVDKIVAESIAALGKISQPKETGDCHDDTRIGHTENEAVQKYITNIDEGIIVGVSLGNFAVANLKGHLDSITGLAVGGGFLFSSSFDKTINVWSLQDYSLVHTFRGHEHRIVALICVEKELPFCISGDSGGGIFIWGITNPFKHEPVRTWYEDKDWRYSGIHALAVHGTEYLYSGSGDKTVKVWSLQDFSLLCKLTGHKSVVSSLAVCHGVLYSGSWDGTVRLWSLNDHSLLTVLGEDMLESGSSVMSLSVYDDVLVVCQENGCIKIWKKDVFKRSLHVHKGAVFAVCLDAKCLFSGGWDRVVHVQELLDDSGQMDVRSVGLVSPESVITALVCWQGKLLVGCADKLIKAYYYYS